MDREASRPKAASYRAVKAGRPGDRDHIKKYRWVAQGGGKADGTMLERQGFVDNGSY